MKNKHRGQAQPQAAHAQPIDPVADALRDAAPGPAAPAEGETHRLQEVLPEIKELAQKVGGMKKLGEIIATLNQSQEG